MKLKKTLACLTIGVAISPMISFVSCGNNNFIPVVDPTQEQKQQQCAEDSNICTYCIEFSDSSKIRSEYTLYVELTDVVTSSGASIKLLDEKLTIENNKSYFRVQIDSQSNNKTNINAQFNVNINCKNYNQFIWTKKITGYKIEKTFDSEKHQITTQSNINLVNIKSDVETVNETTPINLTITNTRQVDVTDASLTIIAGSNHITTALDTLKQDTPLEVLYTKAQLQELFSQKGFNIGDNDPITFQILKVGAYKVEDNHLYKNNELNEFSLVSDNELDTLANRFLYKDQYGDLILNDSDLTFPKYIQSCTPSGNNHVYLLKSKEILEKEEKGYYFTQGANPASGTSDIYVHGLLDSSGNKLSIFRTWRDYAQSGEEYTYGLGQEGIRYHMDHLIMQGRCGQGVPNYYLTDGMVCPYLSCEYCDFTGSYTASTTECHFKNCTFDTTNTWKGTSPSKKNNTAMWLYTGSTAEFENCVFTSIGKAIKIYYGINPAASIFKFKLKNCQFNLVNDHCNYIEYPIAIDASEHTIDIMFDITLDSCSMNELWSQKLQESISGTPNQIYQPKDTADAISGKCKHIKVNNEAPTPFNFDPPSPIYPTQE